MIDPKDAWRRVSRRRIIDDVVDFLPHTPVETMPGIGRGWSRRSLRNRRGVHADLLKLCDTALILSDYDFVIIDGLRTEEEQRAHIRAKRSWTMNSRHLTGHAIDFAVWHRGRVRRDIKYYWPVVEAFKHASEGHGVRITCGADWRSRDMGHVELSWDDYPA